MRPTKSAIAAVLVTGVITAAAACGGSTTLQAGSATPSSATPVVTVTRTAQPPPSTHTSTAAPATSATSAGTATVTATPTQAPAAPTAPLTNASAVVSQYYQDITNHDYASAWALGGDNIAGESYSQYVAGFSTTASISLGTVSDFGSNQVSAVLYATQTDGTVKVYDGTYTVADGELVGASITQQG